MRRLLTETATPDEVLATNDLLREVRVQQRLVEAWEAGRCTAEGGSWDFGRDNPHPDNPYVAGLTQALDRWDAYRRSR